MVHGGGEHQLARAEPCAGSEQHVALLEILSARADVAAGGSAPYRDARPRALGILLDHDGVGAARHGRAGEDAHRFAAADAAREAARRQATRRSA